MGGAGGDLKRALMVRTAAAYSSSSFTSRASNAAGTSRRLLGASATHLEIKLPNLGGPCHAV
jgi:hypothetical protein